MSTAEPPTPAAQTPPSPLRPRRPWRRRLAMAGVGILVIALAFRLSLLVLLPTVISRVAARAGVGCRYERLELDLLGGNVELWGVTITSADGAAELLRTDYAHANISTLELLRLRLVASRIEVDGVKTELVRQADGTIPVLAHFAKSAAGAAAKAGPGAPLDFTPPLRIDALRARSIEAKIRDEFVSPIFERTLRVDARVSDLGVAGAPATVELTLASDGLLDSLRLTGTADLDGPSITADLDFALLGLRPHAAAPYLEPLGLAANDDRVDITGAANVALTSSAASPGALTGTASLRTLAVHAGMQPIAALDAADVTIANLSPSGLHLTSLTIDGGSLRLGRTASGALQLPPMTLGPAPSAAHPAAASTTPAAPPHSPGSPFRWRIDRAAIKGITATFDDEFVTPPTSIDLGIGSLTITDLASEPAPGARASFSAELAAPRLASAIRASGHASLDSGAPALAADITIDGLTLDAAAAYLRPLGLEPTLDSASLRCTLAARLDAAGAAPRLHASVRSLSLRDADAPLLEFSEISLDGLRLSEGLDVDSIKAAGPRLKVTLHEGDVLESCGLRLTIPRPGPNAAAEEPAPTPPTPARAAFVIPKVRIGSLTWGGAAIHLEDLTTDGAEPVEITDAGLEITGLVFDPDARSTPADPGSLRAWVRTPGLVDRFEIEGTLSPAPGSLAADISLIGEGVQLAGFAPYLRPLGIEPTLRDGAVTLHAAASLTQTDGGVRFAATLKDVNLTQAGEPLAGVSRLAVDRVDIRGDAVEIGRIAVESAAIAVERHADRSLELAGVKLPPGSERPEISWDPFAIIASLPNLSLDGLSVRDTRLTWSDHAASHPVEATIAVDMTLGPLAPRNPDAPTSPFELKIAALGIADRFETAGNLRLTPHSIDFDARIDGEGLAAGPVAAYLPPSVEPSLQHALLRSKLTATLSRVDEGGFAASLQIGSLDLREADAPAPLAGLDSLDIRVRRFDADASVIDVERIAAAGVTGHAARQADGRAALLGVVLGRVDDGTIVTPAVPDETPADVQQIVDAARGNGLPAITIDQIDLHVGHATLADQTGALAAPITLTDFHIRSLAPVRVRADRPGASPPIELAVVGGIDPSVRHLEANLRLAPLAQRPTAELTLAADGIDGAGLAAFAPGLESLIDLTPLVDGRLQTSIQLEAGVRRRGRVQIDFSRGLDLTVTIEKTQLRLGEDGPVLAGVERIHGEQIRIEPATGNVLARSLEITGLTGSGWRDEAGIHLLGVVVKRKPPQASTATTTEPQPQSAPENEPAPADPAAPPAPASPPPPQPAPALARSSGEIRIDRLTISGADFRFEDRLLTPPVTIPITALEADVRGLSSLALVQDRTIRFNVSAGAGKVSLPKPVRGGALTGALGDIGRLITGSAPDAAPEMEDRDFFSQCIASGSMSFYPHPRGRILAAISGVELAALRGLAQAAGASVGGGIFDGRVELLGRDDGGLDLESRLIFTDLHYAEPPNGPIARYLNLPMPLDVAIRAVEAADGSITLPIHLTLDGSGLSTGKILGAASGAIASVLTKAVASTPMKVVTGVAGLFSDTTGEKHWTEEEPIILEFAPGLTVLPHAAQEQIAQVLRRARSDKNVQVVIEHEFGPADLELVARRANPPRDQARALAEDLRLRRRELIARRAALVALARATAADPSRAQAADQLREVQAELAEVEDAFDDLYDLLRPNADRQAARRTRAAALDLADARLDHLRRMIREIAGAAGGERIALGNPRAVLGTEGPSRLVIRVRRAGK